MHCLSCDILCAIVQLGWRLHAAVILLMKTLCGVHILRVQRCNWQSVAATDECANGRLSRRGFERSSGERSIFPLLLLQLLLSALLDTFHPALRRHVRPPPPHRLPASKPSHRTVTALNSTAGNPGRNPRGFPLSPYWAKSDDVAFVRGDDGLNLPADRRRNAYQPFK
jgi:hypothetical protein